MARKLRLQYADAIYHVMNRGDRREAVFFKGWDHYCFVESLGQACHFAGENQPRSCGSKPATARCMSSYQFWFFDQALSFRHKPATSRAETS